MATKNREIVVTPKQATWIVERLVADRRISRADIQNLLSDLGEEIAAIEQRLARLREAEGHSPITALPTRNEPHAAKAAKNAAGRKKGHPRGIAGTLAVLLRTIPTVEHAAIQAIRADKGIRAAIKAAKVVAKRI